MTVPSSMPVPTTPAEFRALAPGFSDTTAYSDADITMWLTIAGLLLTGRWGELLGVGTVLFVEHNLQLNTLLYPGGAGTAATALRGPVTSESAGSVSVSYDTDAALQKEAGFWNYTPYGQKFFWLMQMVGAGPVQLNTPPGGIYGACAWNGMALAQVGIFAGPGWYYLA
jgi:hypothetical protein